MILGEVEITGFQDAAGEWVSASDVTTNADREHVVKGTDQVVQVQRVEGDRATKSGSKFVLADDPKIVLESRAHKMSKSRGNVINPDLVVKEYGADSLRLYEMFMGPLEATKPWSMDGVNGVYGFLNRCVADDR